MCLASVGSNFTLRRHLFRSAFYEGEVQIKINAGKEANLRHHTETRHKGLEAYFCIVHIVKSL